MLEINALCLQCGIIFVEIFIGGVHSLQVIRWCAIYSQSPRSFQKISQNKLVVLNTLAQEILRK